MADTIKIKRSDTTATPSSLAAGELAYSENSGNFFIGRIADGVPVKIGGKTDVDKLAGIEANATADQTGAEIKSAYEAEADTNAFTDALLSKLNGIEALADVTDATNVDAAGAVMNSDTTTASMSFVIDEDTLVSNLDTKVPTQQSVKAYVDTEIASALASEMTFKGDYNASTNTPDLDTTPIATAKGDTYVVTVAGTFFTTAVEAGDILIAKQATATLEAHWTIVNKNIDSSAFATAAQGTLADSATQPGDNISTLTNDSGFITGISTLNDVGNVTITANSAGEILKWSGSAWINNTLAEAGIATSAQGALADSATQPGDNISTLTNDSGFITGITGESIKNLSDVFSSMAPTDGQVLTYDTTNGWQAETPAAGVTTFVALTDTPANFTSSGGYIVKVNSGATALEFVNGLDGGTF